MYTRSKIRLTLSFILLLQFSLLTIAHPGRTDSYGCHTCRTNCEKYGIEYGFYHRHNPIRPCFEEENETASTPQPNIEPAPIVSPSKNEIIPSQPILEEPKELEEPITQLPKSDVETAPSVSLPKEQTPPQQTEPNKELEVPLQKNQLPIINTSKLLFKVVSVTDGDTINIEINGKIERVRLLGIDSPETYKKRQCFGDEATYMMKKLVKDKLVRIEKDTIQPNRDRFRRLLRYVYLENGTLVNEEMVKLGYAFAYTKYNSDKLQDFIKLEKKAKSERLGLWNSCSIFSKLFYYISSE